MEIGSSVSSNFSTPSIGSSVDSSQANSRITSVNFSEEAVRVLRTPSNNYDVIFTDKNINATPPSTPNLPTTTSSISHSPPKLSQTNSIGIAGNPPIQQNSNGNGEDEIVFQRLCTSILVEGTLAKDRLVSLKKYSKCFLGRDLINWLLSHGYASNRTEATRTGRNLVQYHFIEAIHGGEHGFKDDKALYRFVDTELFRVTVGIIEARNLHKKEFQAETNCHPYCSVRIGRKRFKTKSNVSLSPRWEECFIFEGVRLADEVKVKVKEKPHLGMSSRYGEVVISVSSIASIAHKKIYHLTCPSLHLTKHSSVGDIVLEMQCEPQTDSYYNISRCYNSYPSFPYPSSNNPKVLPKHPTSNSAKLQPVNNSAPNKKITTDATGTRNRSYSDPPKSAHEIGRSLQHKAPELQKVELGLICKSPKSPRTSKLFRKFFNLPPEEQVLCVYSASLLRKIPFPGRLYISQYHFCFCSSLFGIKIVETIPISSITSIHRQSKTLLSPGVTIKTISSEYHFLHFSDLDKFTNNIIMAWQQKRVILEEHGTSPLLASQEDEFSQALNPHSEGDTEDQNWVKLLEEELPITFEKFFKIFFSDDSNFTAHYAKRRGDEALLIEKWTSSPHGFVRTLSYCSEVSEVTGVKESKSRVEEIQRYTMDNASLSMETAIILPDVPQGDFFRIEKRYNVIKSFSDRCRISVHMRVNWLKRTNLQDQIEGSIVSRCRKQSELWIEIALEEITKLQQSKLSNKQLFNQIFLGLLCFLIFVLFSQTLRLSSRIQELELSQSTHSTGTTP